MQRSQYHEGDLPLSSDLKQITSLLKPSRSTLLELGCGTAATTRKLATAFPEARIVATEVDEIALAKNLAENTMPNVTFQLGGAEAIDLPDDSVDAVIMLKSLHHVPTELMDQAFREIARVLRPGGLAYLSEPVYAGEFNEIMRLFHDEKVVRDAAYAAIARALEQTSLEVADQVFFASSSRFDGFAEFEARILGATHTDFGLDKDLLQKVRMAFSAHLDTDNQAEFLTPQRIDLLRKNAG